jgi:NADH:ubiquinone oxidoreductase subunit H
MSDFPLNIIEQIKMEQAFYNRKKCSNYCRICTNVLMAICILLGRTKSCSLLQDRVGQIVQVGADCGQPLADGMKLFSKKNLFRMRK